MGWHGRTAGLARGPHVEHTTALAAKGRGGGAAAAATGAAPSSHRGMGTRLLKGVAASAIALGLVAYLGGTGSAGQDPGGAVEASTIVKVEGGGLRQQHQQQHQQHGQTDAAPKPAAPVDDEEDFPVPRAGLLPPAAHPDAVNALPCARLEDCYNLTRCKDPETFPVYFYPWKDEEHRTCDFFYPRALRDSPRINRTDNPDEACLLVPNVETACPLNVCAQDHETTMAMLRALPHWDGGRNHVMFSTRDRPPWMCDRAAVVSGGTWLSSYREGLDVAFPLFFPHLQDRNKATPLGPWDLPNATRVEAKGAWGAMPAPGSPRKYLLTFKGHRYPVMAGVEVPAIFKNVDVRDRLRMLHRPPSMVVLTKCLSYQEEHCAEDEAGYDGYAMADLMNTTFGLAPRGYGISSYRVLELLSVNAIPVILQDGSLLPFQEWLDWGQFALLVPEHSTAAIPQILHAMRPATIARMQRRGRRVYETYLKDEEALAWTLVETLKARVTALKARAGAEAAAAEAAARGRAVGVVHASGEVQVLRPEG